MSLNEYLLGNVKAKAQETIDSLEKSLTIMVGIVSVGPIALFVFSTLVNPYLSLIIPIFVTTTVIIVRRIFLRFKNRLNSELLNTMNAREGFIDEILNSNGSLIMNVLGINDSRKWFYLLRALYDEHNDILDSLLSEELQGDLSKNEISLARYILAIRYSSDRLTISALSRGIRTIMFGYYILLFAVPAVAKSLQFLGIHWNALFVVSIQIIISITLLIFARIINKEFNVGVDTRVLFTVIILSILMSLGFLILFK
ncbi:hypothetical protein VMUT_0296 [Vulcanisaeta moutnovskia 768-28]|uniref:Uncharacterized protein n=1 Tax=Vulcanisaeta moutnovskia (strain 768-28) TaxID=985053 RepID=F0QTP4_VULM7|nr:hypothetical protein [Vulcanisaeta moutnovskia]ADY00510.1 hypothetical protein VMUT_0296 [Vulcanisaeta moutnovskia 768-28]